jgi:hypothetical protein
LSSGHNGFFAVRALEERAGERGLSHLEFLLVDGFSFRGLPMLGRAAMVRDTFKFQKGEAMMKEYFFLTEESNGTKRERFYLAKDVDRVLTPGTIQLAGIVDRLENAEVRTKVLEEKYTRIFERIMETISKEV